MYSMRMIRMHIKIATMEVAISERMLWTEITRNYKNNIRPVIG